MSSNKMATKADLQEMYSRILPYLGGSADAGFTPVGTIISVMGVTAPANYLACNGQVVNIADYPELANYFYQQFGSKNKFGGDGTTTFGIPDLRGEFLRGTGTNSHANQGDGAAVGTHQNGTEFPTYWTVAGGNLYLRTGTGADVRMSNVDSQIKHSSTITNVSYAKTGTGETGTLEYKDTARPTNTSVLFCIATKNIYLNPQNDYSTDEKVVGTWIDGKPLYQCTTVITDLPSENMTQTQSAASNIDNVVDIKGVLVSKNGMVDPIPKIQDNSTTLNMGIDVLTSTGLIQLKARATTDVRQNWQKAYVTIQYTKTTS